LVVDGVAPHAADAPGLGKRAAREAAEDVEEHVVREADSVAVCLVHRLCSRRAVVRISSEKGSDPQRQVQVGGDRSSGFISRKQKYIRFYIEETEIDPVSRFRAGAV
jgi:hypothetical protein